jgi:PAS domain-containing protein
VDWLATLYAAPLYAVVALSAALAGYTWRRRVTSGAGAMTVFLLALAVWSLGAALEISAAGLPAKLLWARLEYLGIVALPPAWLVFVLRYTGQRRWLAPNCVALLYAVPFVTWALFLTNGVHGLMWSEVRLDEALPFPALDVVAYGAWFWVHSAYSYALLIASAGLLVAALLRPSRLYRVQSGVFLAALLVPLLVNLWYVSGRSPIPSLDPTPFAFAISGALAVWGLFRFRLLDLVPVARDAVIEGMRDGVIVADGYGRVVDLNPAAQRVLGLTPAKAVGRDVDEVLGDGELPEQGDGGEITLGGGDGRRDYEPVSYTHLTLPTKA